MGLGGREGGEQLRGWKGRMGEEVVVEALRFPYVYKAGYQYHRLILETGVGYSRLGCQQISIYFHSFGSFVQLAISKGSRWNHPRLTNLSAALNIPAPAPLPLTS